MRFAQTDVDVRRPLSRRLMPGLRLMVVLYWAASLGLGYLRLRAEDFSRRAWAEVLIVWYVEALVFLAVFGGAAAMMGVVARQAKEPRRRPKPSDPLSNTTLAAIERHRAH